MKIVIANSKKWFKTSEELSMNNKILNIKSPKELNLDTLKKFNPELIFFPHWNWIVPPEIHRNFSCIIFHTAPLPYGKGGSPIQNLILNGYQSSPVCALQMTNKLDSGPIYIKKILSLQGTLKDIFRNLNLLVNEMIIDLIHKLPNPIEQKGKEYIFKRLSEKDNLIPLGQSILEVFDRIRMVDEDSYPNAYIKFGDLKIEFQNVVFIDGEIKCDAIFKEIKP